MANDVITRFRLETTQFDSALRDAANGLKDVLDQAKAGGKDFNGFSQKSIASARALGQMATASNNAKEKAKELVQVFNAFAREYNALSDTQKRGDFGMALSSSMQQLKERIKEAKQEMQQMQSQTSEVKQETGALGDVMNQLAGKVGLNVSLFTKLGLAGAAVGAALKVAKDAFFESETNVDSWGRTVEGAKSIYKSFLNSINNGDFSGFISGIDSVIQKAKEAYDAIDELGTRMTIINPERAKLQRDQQKYQAQIRMYGKDSEAGKAAQANLKALEPALVKSFQTEAKMNMDAFLKSMRQRAAEGGIILDKKSENFLLDSFSSDRKFNILRNNATGEKGKKWVFDKFTGQGHFENYDTRNTNAKLLDIFTDEWRQQNQGFLTGAFNAESQAWGTLKANARYLKNNTPTPKTPKTPKPTEEIKVIPGSMRALEKELAELSEAQKDAVGHEDWQRYQNDIEAVRQKMAELRGETKKETEAMQGLSMQTSQGLAAWRQMQSSALQKMEYGSEERRATQANLTDTTTFENLLNFADANGIVITKELDKIKDTIAEQLMEGIDVPDKTLEEFVNAINEKLQSMQLDPIEIDFKTGNISVVKKEATVTKESWKDAANAVRSVGSAMQQIDDPTMKVMGIIGEAIANIALGFASATSKDTAGGVFHWIAAVAAGMGTMLATISSIKSATAGSYAQGGIIPGNSPTGDLLTANVNSGELILNRAQQDNLASQLETAENRSIVLDTKIKGEDIYLVQRTYSRRKGWGEVVRTR